MTLWPIKIEQAFADAFFDPDGDPVRVKKINGVDVDWLSQPGGLFSIAMPHGTLKISNNWPVLTGHYDDGGTLDGHPQPGRQLVEGTFTYTLSDGTNEVGPWTVDLKMTGFASLPPPPPLTNTVPPSISGGTAVGSVLTRVAGTWTGNGTVTVTGRWTRDNVTIAGETGATYTTVSGDIGTTIRYAEDATDATPASSTASSNGVGVTPIALANTALPTFMGTPTVGSTLTYTAGAWVGTGTITKGVDAWLRDGVPISGATGATYTLTAADQGHQVGVREIATDSLTSATAVSTTVTVSASSTINATVLNSNVDTQFASDPEFGWPGFPAGTAMTVQTATHPDQVKAQMDSWAAGTPSTSALDIVCDWNGLLANSAGRWFGPAAGKLSSDPSALWGYSLGTGGVRLRAAPGKTPIFDKRLEITGVTRLEIDGVRFAGSRDGITNETDQSLKFTRQASYPTLGLIAIKNTSIGHYDNRGPSLVQGDLTNAISLVGGKSFYLRDVRFAGLNTVCILASEYIDIDRVDIQKTNEDCFGIRGYTGALASRYAWVRARNILVRDSTLFPTSLHPDLFQMGTGGDTGHLGYRYAFKQIMAHLGYDPAGPVNQGSQACFTSLTPSPANFTGGWEDSILAINAYHGWAMYDPSQAGHLWANRVAWYRAGMTATGGDTYPWINVGSGVANGGSRGAESCTFTTINGGQAAALQMSGCRYVSPKKNISAGQNGMSSSTPKRLEEVIAATGGTISRDGTDYMTYTIADEGNPDSNAAFAAMRAFYTPLAGWGSAGQPNDPNTWVGSFGDY